MAEKGSFLKKSLKWAFRIAVWGIGFGIGSELITEFLFYGVLHSANPLSGELAAMSLEFTEPIMNGLSNMVGGPEGLGWMKGMLKGIHELFGVTGTFAPAVLPDVTSQAVQNLGGALPEVLVPGLP